MRALLISATIVSMASGTASATPKTRVEFARAIATLAPGMTSAEAERVLGPPDDIRTERDPGGIPAARTHEVWRWGTHGHLTFGTLGTVHVQADGRLQYVFGGKGTPITGIAEPDLAHLLELVDAVPSYNAPLDPARLIRAVDALQPLGKERALAVVDEYLRVSSTLDDPGREGVFLVMRALFDVPAGGMPPMRVGGTIQPTDPKALPRFPLAIVDDVPLKLVNGYALAGMAERPEDDVAAFRKVGTLRVSPLAPSPRALEAIHAYVEKSLGAAMTVDDNLRLSLYDQALHLMGTVARPADATIDSWFPYGPDLATRWAQRRAEIGKLAPVWDARGAQFVRADGTTLATTATIYQRVWWDLGIPKLTTARLVLERRSDAIVEAQLRFAVPAGAAVAADTIRLVDVATGKPLGAIELAAEAASTTGHESMSSQRLTISKGTAIRVELVSGRRGPTLVP